MAVRTCLVSVCDVQGVEHTVEVTAETLFEAVALGLRIFRENAWVGEIGNGLTAVQIAVKQPEIRHTVLLRDFDRWLSLGGGSPAEVSLKHRVRKLLR